MSYHDGRLFVFGGIHDITWELDDLHIYNLKVQYILCRLKHGPLLSMILLAKFKKITLQKHKTKNKKTTVLRKKVGTIAIIIISI